MGSGYTLDVVMVTLAARDFDESSRHFAGRSCMSSAHHCSSRCLSREEVIMIGLCDLVLRLIILRRIFTFGGGGCAVFVQYVLSRQSSIYANYTSLIDHNKQRLFHQSHVNAFVDSLMFASNKFD